MIALEHDLDTLTDGPFSLPREAASIALILYLELHDGLEKEEFERLKGKFLRAVASSQVGEDLLPSRVRYARRLATDENELIYEELHKLFSLCENIFVLTWLGFEIEDDVYAGYVADVKQRLMDQKRSAKLVAEDKSTIRDEKYWWMAYVADL